MHYSGVSIVLFCKQKKRNQDQLVSYLGLGIGNEAWLFNVVWLLQSFICAEVQYTHYGMCTVWKTEENYAIKYYWSMCKN